MVSVQPIPVYLLNQPPLVAVNGPHCAGVNEAVLSPVNLRTVGYG